VGAAPESGFEGAHYPDGSLAVLVAGIAAVDENQMALLVRGVVVVVA